MSAYIVNDSVINRIAALLSDDEFGPERIISDSIKKLGYSAFDHPEQLARHMHNLNRFAMNERYGRKLPYTHRYKAVLARDTYQILKDIQCFMYQCSEGRATKTRLFKAFENVENDLAHELVRMTEEYKNAKWDKE
ncbi:MAG: hypothetical protein AABZ39_09015 [Spirochaetota bacterium]